MIAVEIAKLAKLQAAPCFVAIDQKANEVGVAVEFFYGHPGSPIVPRLVSGADIMKRSIKGYDEKTGRQHNVRTNLETARVFKAPDYEVYWGTIFVFDALIGNTDRHPENWGFLAKFAQPGTIYDFAFAPSFDHGTSLGYETAEQNLAKAIEDRRIESYILRGRHHIRWEMDDEYPAAHVGLCKRYRESYPNAAPAMRQVVAFRMEDLSAIVNSFVEFKLPAGNLSQGRADYILELVRRRKKALEAVLV